MVKKIFIGVILSVVMGLLVYGAVLRTAETNSESINNVSAGGRGRGRTTQSESGLALDESHVVEWVTIVGTISEVTELHMVVNTYDGQAVAIEDRAWLMAKSALNATTGDEVSLLGFFEGDSFEVGNITVPSSGQVVAVRDENGYPLWSGRGRTW